MHVGAIRRYAPAFSTITYSRSTSCTRFCGRLFLNCSDARIRLPGTPVPVCLGRLYPFAWDACARLPGTPVPVSVRTRVGWNFILTHTVCIGVFMVCRTVSSCTGTVHCIKKLTFIQQLQVQACYGTGIGIVLAILLQMKLEHDSGLRSVRRLRKLVGTDRTERRKLAF